jgi:hypothetical protein
VYELEQLPIRRIAFTTPADDRARLLRDAQILYERTLGTNDEMILLNEFVAARLEREQGDVVHDLLAFLAEQMMAMNEEKQAVVDDFWLDLEGAADPDAFDTLRNKGKWESTLWKAEACRPFVAEDSRRTRSLDESLGWNEDCFKAFVKMLAGSVGNLSNLVRVYRKHHPRYRDLAGRLARTDHLIDQIVYQLYGLTDEEIAIVEGKSTQ